MIRVLILALCLSPFALAEENPLPPVNEKACVIVSTPGGSGSGTIVGKTGATYYVVTAAHVVDDPQSKELFVLQRHVRKPKSATVVRKDDVVDIALVRVEGLDGEPVKIATEELKEGDYVAHFGKATGPQDGKVAHFTNYVATGKTANLAYFSTPGDSGAGVFNKAGELVGVHYARTNHPNVKYENQTSLASRLDYVKKITKDYVK